MAQRYPSVKDIVNSFETIDDLIEWALENQMQDHTLINQRISNYINKFENAENLTEWAIHNYLLNVHRVLNRIQTLYTCKWCGRRSESIRELHVVLKSNRSPWISLWLSWSNIFLLSSTFGCFTLVVHVLVVEIKVSDAHVSCAVYNNTIRHVDGWMT